MRSSGHFDNKQQAMDAGRSISQNQKTEFLSMVEMEKFKVEIVMEETPIHLKVNNNYISEETVLGRSLLLVCCWVSRLHTGINF